METLRNRGCFFVLATLQELSWQYLMFFFLFFTLCSAHTCISALVIVLSESTWERIGKWEICPILVRIFAVASATKNDTLLDVSTATVSKVMSAYTNHGKITSARGTVGEKHH
jgi:hypothetical protein